jgi:hypothetical protein
MTSMRAIAAKHFPASQLAPKRSKYGNRKTVLDGMVFASAAEARRWSELKILERAGDIADLKRQVPFACEVNGEIVTKYIADFTYTRGPDHIVEDTKGVETALFRLKSKLMHACHGVTVQLGKVRR